MPGAPFGFLGLISAQPSFPFFCGKFTRFGAQTWRIFLYFDGVDAMNPLGVADTTRGSL